MITTSCHNLFVLQNQFKLCLFIQKVFVSTRTSLSIKGKQCRPIENCGEQRFFLEYSMESRQLRFLGSQGQLNGTLYDFFYSRRRGVVSPWEATIGVMGQNSDEKY